MAPSVAEIKAAVAVMSADHGDATLEDVAKLVIDALDNVRWKKDKWVMVARIKLPGGQWHNFAMGPYSTIGQAQKAGESFSPNAMPYKRDGDCFFRVVPMVMSDRPAWESIRPEHVDHLAYIIESLDKWDPWVWARAVAERDGWAHKPKIVKDITDKSEDHA